MKIWLGIIGVLAFAQGSVCLGGQGDWSVTSGIYKVTDGGLTKSTCPSIDRLTITQQPWWVVQTVGPKVLNIKQANSFTSVPTELWGNITLEGGSYGVWEGTGYVITREGGPLAQCTLRRDITAKINSFWDGSLMLDATVKVSHRNPDFENQICTHLDLPECSYSFSYQLEQEK